MRLLRDIREGTKVLLLLELTRRRHTRLKGLAEKLGLTVAGVSDYMKAMQNEGLVAHVGGEYRATKEGVEFLQSHVLALRDFVDTSLSEMAIIDEALAVAADAVAQGHRLGLFMEGGTLVARKRKSPSTGVAAFPAAKGEVVLVRDLEGIVTLKPGKIAIARMPPIRRGDRKLVQVGRKVVRHVKPDLVAALDVRGRSLAVRMGVDRLAEFAPIAASIEAAQRGLRVLVLSPEDRVGEVVAAIEGANERTVEKVLYETVNLTGGE